MSSGQVPPRSPTLNPIVFLMTLPLPQAVRANQTVLPRNPHPPRRNPPTQPISPLHQFLTTTLADPDLYDTLVRQFQTPAEREAEGRAKGYSRVLEGSLLRGEARLERLAAAAASHGGVGGTGPASSSSSTAAAAQVRPAAVEGEDEDGEEEEGTSLIVDVVDVDLAPPPADKAAGQRRWEDYLRDRFVRGRDDDFEYALVDGNDEYDVLERRDEEDAWFDDEDPGWASDRGGGDGGAREGTGGETGVQDF